MLEEGDNTGGGWRRIETATTTETTVHISVLRGPFENTTNKNLSSCELEICRVEEIIVEGSIEGSVVHFNGSELLLNCYCPNFWSNKYFWISGSGNSSLGDATVGGGIIGGSGESVLFVNRLILGSSSSISAIGGHGSQIARGGSGDIILATTNRSSTLTITKIIPYEAFVCPCKDGDVVLRESYKPKTRGKLYYACLRSKPWQNTFGCKFFYGKRNESVYWLVLLELQRIQFILQDLHRLQFILQELQEMQSAQSGSLWFKIGRKQSCGSCLRSLTNQLNIKPSLEKHQFQPHRLHVATVSSHSVLLTENKKLKWWSLAFQHGRAENVIYMIYEQISSHGAISYLCWNRLARVLQTPTTSPAPWSKKCVSGSPALHKVLVFEATKSDSPTFFNCNDHFSPYEEACAIDQGDQEPGVPGVALQDSNGALVIQLLDAILEKNSERLAQIPVEKEHMLHHSLDPIKSFDYQNKTKRVLHATVVKQLEIAALMENLQDSKFHVSSAQVVYKNLMHEF
uniref:RNA-directed DNA polymerase, eukaryota n=1 Tax=Tanacetum cinerariifolium TaxID=118510 RepID=A0A6L2K7Q4_TANCI|nr:RNA-directed DNA polymerase, eukaryota [Tanacetum cinerariifolium]